MSEEDAVRSGDGSNGGDGSPDGLTHTDDAGDVQMVDVGAKPDSSRRAVARGEIRLTPGTIAAVEADAVEKGDVLGTARIGAVQAVKHTWETIPMCHQIPITNVDAEFAVGDDRIELTVAVETTGKTGCEMEALEGVTTGLNTVWDMVKAAEKDGDGQYPDTRIADVKVVDKRKETVDA
ncbi:cyclic pyranopterin monophosphate synthase MoaC [Halorubrum ezzemoulense]|uniref:cyclic pyranopterin monophosphate synthase MoaC n=1 Tax=Halorubrum ezzemoulense TaxID=337243 RepID=UPI00232B0CF7|nr:cyclic pyranopterin monophosphate synthase MoaC [Halorubrum ezzemoulense]MDB9247670.1 cyclic pyranopterin monophosphate synthase MoaC [Halorubrum ezzemoulense]MDB9258421.1 cyclic pyranopterin monophosphate synthase MoaC [Halorubrum ezzemoulense]MDB9261217.1 cyclic pyranopterin monophosphate synthase MoaC [Halorubrum ezzemoulense]MDB9264720.1 cyclic pyranopterin monophosphate synthase MoaC [Halorubrum ezzemoulense]MDB9268782.1 cyclic pyranopterin monophosphate synthase MoaC [Halorubrum ezzem